MSSYLTYDERLEIQKGLKNQLSFGKISEVINKDRTTVAKEIKKYSYEQKTGYSCYPYNVCIHRKNCAKKNVCQLECTTPSKQKCSICKFCNDVCGDFQEEVCSHRNRAPYVCNGCEELNRCTLKKLIYDAEDAQLLCQSRLSESRTGILSNEFDLARINTLIPPLEKTGQSIQQV